MFFVALALQSARFIYTSEVLPYWLAWLFESSASKYGRPICVTVCDASGLLLAFHRMNAPVLHLHRHPKMLHGGENGQLNRRFCAPSSKRRPPGIRFCDEKLTPLRAECRFLTARAHSRGDRHKQPETRRRQSLRCLHCPVDFPSPEPDKTKEIKEDVCVATR